MMRSNRGAARVSAVWIISVGVLFLAAVAFAFIAQNDLSNERDKVSTAQQSLQEAIDKEQIQASLRRDISEVTGWYPESVDISSNPDSIKQALADLKTTFTDVGASDDTLEKALPKIVAAYNARGARIAELETNIQTLTNENSAKDTAAQQIRDDKDTRISTLSGQLADEQQNAATREAELQDRLTTAQNQLSDRDQELRQVRADLQVAARGFDDERKIYETRIAALSDTVRFTKEPFSQYPDGKVIEVSEKLGIGWIDIGANQRLTRGTRFRVESGTPGAARFKAWAEVIGIEANRAEVKFVGQVDRYDPVAPGDQIINPLYDPTGGRNAVLVGRFSGAYNEKDLGSLLERMGINVQPELDLTTHFLIVGSEIWNDPETNEPLEEPIPVSDLAVYKNAEALGVQVIPLQDIREFFRLGVAAGM